MSLRQAWLLLSVALLLPSLGVAQRYTGAIGVALYCLLLPLLVGLALARARPMLLALLSPQYSNSHEPTAVLIFPHPLGIFYSYERSQS